MASFGHVAVGMLTGRLHGGGERDGKGAAGGPPDGGQRAPCSWKTLLVFAGLALLPDADVILVTLGACDAGACGHRGASHSLPLALAVGLMAALAARKLGWPVVRTMLATTFAVGSHALLDVLSAGGRGLPLFWPFSSARFVSPIRIFSDAPRGLALLSWPGITAVAIELAICLPVMIYAMWPRITIWASARAVGRGISRLPRLTFLGVLDGLEASGEQVGRAKPDLGEAILIEGGAGLSPAPAPTVSDDRDPPIRSVG
jgi:inner membrane protein